MEENVTSVKEFLSASYSYNPNEDKITKQANNFFSIYNSNIIL